jgi:hypothetical protein
MTGLRELAVPRDLELLCMGHAPEEVGDLYSKLNDDTLFRQEWAEQVGLGFQLVHFGIQTELTSETSNIASLVEISFLVSSATCVLKGLDTSFQGLSRFDKLYPYRGRLACNVPLYGYNLTHGQSKPISSRAARSGW